MEKGLEDDVTDRYALIPWQLLWGKNVLFLSWLLTNNKIIHIYTYLYLAIQYNPMNQGIYDQIFTSTDFIL